MTKKIAQSSFNNHPALNEKIEYWLLKILLELGGHKEFIHKDYFSDDQIAAALQLDHWISEKDSGLDHASILNILRQRLEIIQRQMPLSCSYNQNLTQNLAALKIQIGLTDCDIAILEFMLISQHEHILGNATDLLGFMTTEQIYRVFAIILDYPEGEIRQAFSHQNELLRTGLIRLDTGMPVYFRAKIELLSRNFIEMMLQPAVSPFSLLKDVVSKSQPSMLTLANFQYLDTKLAIVLPYLQHAFKTRKKGVNLLIYGEPGTGKTELARVLADYFTVPAYEVTSEDGYGEPAEKGNERMLAYLAAQKFFAHQKSLIIFDEIEDIFQDESANSSASFSKAWLNRILENNEVPALWICNDTYYMDTSILRRFDIVLELTTPPKAERKMMLDQALEGRINGHILSELAQSESLVPALINRVASVLNPIKETMISTTEDAAITLINGTLKAQGIDEICVQKIGGLSDIYDPKFTNSDTDLGLLATRLKTYNEARVCLYGPSGTGKSAYAHWLSDFLNKPLLIKKVSDLIDKYVGETEKQIAEAFKEASDTQAILLLDEVDSFLCDRRFAQHSYEVTMVNEMLMQMERFSGIFIATTNLMDQMDQAVLRRFDFKSKFDFLRHDQAWELFNRQCAYLGFTIIEPDLEKDFQSFYKLTPGDFAITARQAKLGVITSPEEIVVQLKKESQLKENRGTTIGFVK